MQSWPNNVEILTINYKWKTMINQAIYGTPVILIANFLSKVELALPTTFKNLAFRSTGEDDAWKYYQIMNCSLRV